MSSDIADRMETIIASVEAAKECEFRLRFDPTLVRGQSYYTGTIFASNTTWMIPERSLTSTNTSPPLLRFFCRIVMLLLENGYEVPKKGAKKAYLLDKQLSKEGMLDVLSRAKEERSRNGLLHPRIQARLCCGSSAPIP